MNFISPSGMVSPKMDLLVQAANNALPIQMCLGISECLVELVCFANITRNLSEIVITIDSSSKNDKIVSFMSFLEFQYQRTSTNTVESDRNDANQNCLLSTHQVEGLRLICALSLTCFISKLVDLWSYSELNSVTVSTSLINAKWSAESYNAMTLILMRCVNLYLHLIRGKNLYIQDTCCLGLCLLFELSKQIENQNYNQMKGNSSTDADMLEVLNKKRSLSGVIADEVILILTKEKRIKPIAGYEPNADISGSVSSAQTNSVVGTLNVNTVMQTLQGTNQLDALAYLEDIGPIPVPPPNATTTEITANNTAQRNESTENEKDSFSAYSAICKVAYKAGGAQIVFAVLSIIRNNNKLGNLELEKVLQCFSKQCAIQYKFSFQEVKKLLPMLYLARYDPSNLIRNFMNQLWQVIVVDSEHASTLLISEQSEVVTYCLNNMKSSNWRDRESAVSALESYLPDKAFASVIFPFLNDLFLSSLRVMDDMRESTRKAGLNCMKVIGNHIVYSVSCQPFSSNWRANVETTGSSQKKTLVAMDVLNIMVPLLLDKGLLVTFPEGKGYCMGLLMRIIKESKGNLNSWLIQIVSVLIEGMSGLEPQSLQYMHFHAAKLNLKPDELDAMRVKMSQVSPLQEALTQCLQHSDLLAIVNGRTLLIDAILRISEYIQSGVGLATRAAAANSLAVIIDRYPDELKCKSVLANRSDMRSVHGILEKVFYVIYKTLSTSSVSNSKVLSQALVSTMGVLVKIINPNVLRLACVNLLAIQKQLDAASTIESSSLQCGGNEDFIAVAMCINQIVSKGGEQLNIQFVGSDLDEVEEQCDVTRLWKQILSRAYIGMFDKSDDDSSNSSAAVVSTLWSSTWNECLLHSSYGIKSSALLKILGPLLDDLEVLLTSFSWNRRILSIAVLNDLLISLGSSELAGADTVAQLLAPNIGSLVRALLLNIINTNSNGISLWNGKDRVVEVLMVVLQKCKNRIVFSTNIAQNGCEPLMYIQNGNEQIALLSVDASGAADVNTFGLNSIEKSLSFSKKDLSQWHISGNRLLNLLIGEIERCKEMTVSSNNNYRIAVARSLAAFQWGAVGGENNAVRNVSFSSVLPKLCSIVGIPLELDCTDLHSSKLAHLLNRMETDNHSHSQSTQPKQTIVVPKKTLSTAQANLNMFGSRYGGSANSTFIKPVNTKRKLDVVQSVNEVPIVVASGAVLSSASIVDPAVRVKLVECMANGIHLLDMDMHIQLVSSLIYWCVLNNLPASMGCHSDCIWTIRKASFQLLNAIIAALSNKIVKGSSLSVSLSLLVDLTLLKQSLFSRCIEHMMSEDKKQSQLVIAGIQHGVSLTTMVKLLYEHDYLGTHYLDTLSCTKCPEILTKDEFIVEMNKIIVSILDKYPDMPNITQELSKWQHSLRNA